MVEYIKKNEKLIFLFILIVQCGTIIYFANIKEGYHIDEFFSLEGASNGGKLCLYWDLNSDFYGNWHNNKEFMENITVNQKESIILNKNISISNAFQNGYNYYVLLNIFSSIIPNVFSKWIGIGLNLIFFVLSQIALYFLSKEILENKASAIIPILFYGFSPGAISLCIFIRDYMMVTFLTIVFVYLLVKMSKVENIFTKIFLTILSFVVFYLGYDSHHLFSLFGVIFLLCFIIMIFLQKNLKSLKIFCTIYFFGGIYFLFYELKNVESVFVNDNVGKMSLSFLLDSNIQRFLIVLKNYILIIIQHTFVNILFAIFLIVVSSILVFKVRKIDKNKCKNIEIVNLLLISSTLFLLVVAKMTTPARWRYISQLFIIFTLIITSIILIYACKMDILEICVKGLLILCVITLFNTVLFKKVEELYIGTNDLKVFLEDNYSDVDGVFIGEGKTYMYNSAFCWPEDSEVYIEKYNVFMNSDAFLKQYNKDTILLWVNIDYMEDEIVQAFLDKTQFDYSNKIYTTDYATIFEISKK